MMFGLTGGGDVIYSLPGAADVCGAVMATFGKILCYYFVEISTPHHPGELPYRCRGCQSSETQESTVYSGGRSNDMWILKSINAWSQLPLRVDTGKNI